MKTIKKCLIWGIVLMLCVLIWPICLVRKADKVYPDLNAQYEESEPVEKKMEQVFVAQTSYLKAIAVDFKVLEETENDVVVQFMIEDGGVN